MANKFLDSNGLTTLWSLIKSGFVAKVTGKDLSTNDYTTDEKTKLSGIAAGAEVNQNAYQIVEFDTTDVTATAKTDRLKVVAGTGVQFVTDATNKTVTVNGTAVSSIDDAMSTTSTNAVQNKVITAALANKVDVVSGKGLSTNDYTSDEKTKLAGIETGAEVNVNADWSASSGDAQILNKPTAVSAFSNDSGYQTAANVNALIATAVASAYKYIGSVATEADLPTTSTTGYVYNIVAASSYGAAGMNVAWTGTAWDALGSNITVDAMTTAEITAICA